jgi:hypothetical protein
MGKRCAGFCKRRLQACLKQRSALAALLTLNNPPPLLLQPLQWGRRLFGAKATDSATAADGAKAEAGQDNLGKGRRRYPVYGGYPAYGGGYPPYGGGGYPYGGGGNSYASASASAQAMSGGVSPAARRCQALCLCAMLLLRPAVAM